MPATAGSYHSGSNASATGGGGATSGSAASDRHRFAWVLVAVQLAVGALGGYLCYEGDAGQYAQPLSHVLGALLGLLVWSATLPAGSSPWPLRVPLLILPPAMFVGQLTSTHTREQNNGVGGFLGMTIFAGYLFWSLPMHLALTSAKDALLAEYAGVVGRGGLRGLAPTALRIGAEHGAAVLLVCS